MNGRLVIRAVAALLVVIGLAMGTAVPVAWAMGDSQGVVTGLGLSVAVTLAAAVVALLALRRKMPVKDHFCIRDGFAIVTFSWILAAVFGALPFVLVANMHWYDAFFETMSGFSTTGASVLDSTLTLRNGKTLEQGLAGLPYGLLYWRSLTHWLGGMGIVVLSLAILPTLGIGAHQLYLAEVPGHADERIAPRIADSAKILWGVYLVLSLAETGLLMLGGMSLFDAWCHTCGTMATGGFSTNSASIGGFDSVYIDVVITVFMFLAGTNFVLHFRALRGRPITYINDEEFRFYAAIAAIATVTVALTLTGGTIISTSGTELKNVGFFTALRYAAFQVVSILTTTGFATADFALWPAYAGLLLVVLMFVGGCSGSTGGGMKNARILLILKYGFLQIERCVFRRTVANVRLNQQRLNESVIHKILAFFCLFVSLHVLVSLALCLLGVDDVVTAATASIAALGNIGPGLGGVGATCTYAWMSPPAKMVLCLAMLLGRLELYTVLVLFLPSFYK